MRREVDIEFKETLKRILSKYDEIHIVFDRRENRLELYFVVELLGDWKCVGNINMFSKDCSKVVMVFDNGVVVFRKEISKLSTKTLVKKVVSIAKSVGFDISYSTGDWKKEEVCSLILRKGGVK